MSTWKKNHCISTLLKLNAILLLLYLIMPYQSVGDFPVDVMMNHFNISNWNYNDDLDLYESIDLIKDYYNIMTDKLWR